MKLNFRAAVVVDGCRIPFQRSSTGYKKLRSYDLGRMAVKALLERNSVDPSSIDRVILGTVISNLATSNVARESALGAGIPDHVPAHTVTQACVSANQAVTSGVDLIRASQAEIVVAGGTESMSDVPIPLRRPLRDKLVEAQRYKGLDWLKFLKGLRPSDFLPAVPAISEFSTQRTMGEDCDQLAARYGVTRQEQDEFALRSHKLAHQAWEEGWLQQEVEAAHVPPDFETVDKDNGIRADSNKEKLAKLRPAFVKPYGTVTAGNSSFLTDGAAAVLLMSDEKARSLGLQPKAFVRAYAWTAQDPYEELLLGPAYSVPKALDKAGVQLADIDVFEFHEAFAGQILANLKCLQSDSFAADKLNLSQAVGEVPMERLNLWGGSLSLGHPFGATGARIITTACNRLLKEDGQLALVASCAAGAIGNAIVLERIH
ncbi:MAG TPA: acetyl-CoA C-acyltransferase [Acidobacteriota bacterium]|nr:acetyl-CoA C-acyltransferase [Acidobacteriota bacterium]